MSFDLVVVGGGLAGLTTGLRAAELGLRTAVLEKGTAELYLCNSRMSGGVFHVAARDPRVLPPEELAGVLVEETWGTMRPELARLIGDNAARGCSWLESNGASFTAVEMYHGRFSHDTALAPLGTPTTHANWPGRGPDLLLRELARLLGQRGGVLLRGHEVTRLLRNGERVAGVEAHTPAGSVELPASHGVVLADGGFQGDADLVRRYVSPRPEAVRQRGAGTGIGTGLRLAQEAGAKLVGMDSFYGHLLNRDSLSNDRLWPYPYVDAVATAGIIVDGSGRRFTDEGRGGVDMANQLARSDDPAGAFTIADATTWNGPAAAMIVPPAPNPGMVENGGTVYQADTIEELAHLCGLPVDVLGHTVAEFGEAARSGRLEQLRIPRTQTRDRRFPPASPIETPPFVAIPTCPGLTFTMGGPLIDSRAQVVAEDSEPISGLYAAGSAAGGFEGGERVGYSGGLMRAVVTGLAAAEAAAESAPR